MATTTRSPGSAPVTKTTRPSSSRPTASPPAATDCVTIVVVMRPIEIAPSVLPADFARLGEEIAALEEAGVDRIQWDVMDGRFVPNLTFGPDVIAAARKHSSLPFEAHLMVLEPQELMAKYVDAGCDLIIIHAEACTHLHRTLAAIRDLGAKASV